MRKRLFSFYVRVLRAVQTLALLYALTIGILWYIKGKLWFKQTILPVHDQVFVWLFALTVFMVIPLLALKASRPFSRQFLYELPYFFGGIAWFSAASYCLNSLGKFWFIFGSCIVGFGVIPIAVAGTVIKGHWAFLGYLFFQLAVTFGCRYLALAVVQSSRQNGQG